MTRALQQASRPGSYLVAYVVFMKRRQLPADLRIRRHHILRQQVIIGEPRQLFKKVFAPGLGGDELICNNSAWRQLLVMRSINWTAGNHVLIGDAQTSAHFSIGSGTRIAMEDAITLAEALTECAPAGSPEPTPRQRLANFVQKRGPEKDKLLTAARRSYPWYENIGEWMQRYTPFEFIHAFMTRTGRLDNERLAKQYPELFAQFLQASALG